MLSLNSWISQVKPLSLECDMMRWENVVIWNVVKYLTWDDDEPLITLNRYAKCIIKVYMLCFLILKNKTVGRVHLCLFWRFRTVWFTITIIRNSRSVTNTNTLISTPSSTIRNGGGVVFTWNFCFVPSKKGFLLSGNFTLKQYYWIHQLCITCVMKGFKDRSKI